MSMIDMVLVKIWFLCAGCERRLNGRRYWELGMMLRKTDVWRFTKKKKKRLKRVYYQSKKKKFGRKMNQDVNGNSKLFRKEVSKVNRKVESCS